MLVALARSSRVQCLAFVVIYFAEIDRVKMTNSLTCRFLLVSTFMASCYLGMDRIVTGRITSVEVASALLVIVADEFRLQGPESTPYLTKAATELIVRDSSDYILA